MGLLPQRLRRRGPAGADYLAHVRADLRPELVNVRYRTEPRAESLDDCLDVPMAHVAAGRCRRSRDGKYGAGPCSGSENLRQLDNASRRSSQLGMVGDAISLGSIP